MTSAVSTALATPSTSTGLLRLLGSVAGRLARDEDPLQFIDGVFGELAGPLGVSAYLYYQADREGHSLNLLAYRGIDETVAEQLDLVATSSQRPEPCIWPAGDPQRAASDASLPDFSARLNLRVGAHLPLCAASRCLGSLVVAGQREPFSAEEIELIEAVCNIIGAALDRGRLEYQLQTEHARFRALLDHIPAAVLLADAHSGRIVMGNPQAERMLGHPVAAPVEGQTDESALVEQCLVRALSGQSDQAIDYLFRRSDGIETWLRASSTPIRDPQGRVIGGLITCYDIDQEKRAEAALRDSEERFRQLADATPQIVWAADPEGRVDYFNRQWFEYTNSSAEQSHHEVDWQQVVHPDDLAHTLDKWSAAVRSGTPLEIENRLFDRARGEYRWHLVRALPLLSPVGQVMRWLGTATDIDERIRAQHDLLKADRSKDEFLAILGHELRNPLAAIGYAVALLKANKLDNESRDSVELIRGQVELISRLIEDLLDLSRVKQGKITIEKQLVDLRELAERSVEVTRRVFDERRHKLDVAMPLSCVMLDADPTRLEQVLVNLLNNAAKYTEPGGRISLSVDVEGERACLKVRDNGIGMSSETLTSAFHLFSQDSTARHRSKEGLGIGLALVEALVSLHQGTVTAHSDGMGKGSEFVVYLPLSSNHTNQATPSPAG